MSFLPAWMTWTALVLTALALVLAGLKVLHIITWAWWVVALPLLAPAAIAALFVVVVLLWQAGGSH